MLTLIILAALFSQLFSVYRPCIIERDIHHYDQMTREQQQKLRPAFVSPNVLTVGQRTTVKTGT